MSKYIDFYFDIISPYSYIAYKKIRKIKENQKIIFNYKPILLGGLHNLAGISAPALNKYKMTKKKAVIFDMDECLGSFWSLWPLYDLYVDGHITNYDKLLDITSQTILPSCLRPKLDLLLNFLNYFF